MAWNEILANALYAISVLLAARNSVHTWWTGILGCLVFSWVFFAAQLYADVALMQFYIATSAWGWRHWLRGSQGQVAPIRRTQPRALLALFVIALAVTAGYGGLLYHFTDAYSPFVDSAVMAFSILAQLLLMQRRLENWMFWIIVNTLAVPLYTLRELHVTAGLYTIFWCNAWWGWYRWHQEHRLAGSRA